MKTSRPSYAVIFRILTYLCIAGLLFLFWKQQNDLAAVKAQYGQLQEEKDQLQQDLATAGAAGSSQNSAMPQPAMTSAPKRHPGAGARTAQEIAAADAQQTARHAADVAALVPAPDVNKLILSPTNLTAKPVEGGIAATLDFNANKAGPLGLVALAIRIPKESSARIFDLTPVIGIEKYTDSTKEISGDGKFAFFQGTLVEDTDVQFTLSVTEPVTALVRGTRGIGPLLLNVQPNGATIMPK